MKEKIEEIIKGAISTFLSDCIVLYNPNREVEVAIYKTEEHELDPNGCADDIYKQIASDLSKDYVSKARVLEMFFILQSQCLNQGTWQEMCEKTENKLDQFINEVKGQDYDNNTRKQKL